MAKRKQDKFLMFRVGATITALAVCFAFGAFIKNSLAQSWSEPTATPPSGNVLPPIWNQNSSAQTGSMYLTGSSRFDSSNYGNSYCTLSKVCGADAGDKWAIVGESNSGYGLYGSSVSSYGLFAASSSSYAGYFSGAVYVNGSLSTTGTIQQNGHAVCLADGTNCPSGGGGYWTASGNNIYNSNTANVGIGTTNPLAKLYVAGNQAVGAPAGLREAAVFDAGGSASGDGPMIGFAGYGGAVSAGTYPTWRFAQIGAVFNSATGWGGDLVFRVNKGSSATDFSEKMRILYNGNVGINAANPSGLLEVNMAGTSNAIAKVGDYPAASQVRIGCTVCDNSTKVAITYFGQGGGGAAIEFGRAAAGWNTYQAFYTNTGTAASGQMSERMRLNESGYLGIGTASPGSRLDVQGGAATGINIGVNAGVNALLVSSNGIIRIDAPGVPGGRLTLLENGNLGLGTATPNNKIQVAGLINFDPVNSNAYMGQYAGNTNTSGNANVAVGPYALYYNTTGSGDTAIGFSASQNNTTGFYNTALGYMALKDPQTASYNIAIGSAALVSLTSGDYNTAVGVNALSGASGYIGNENTAVGKWAIAVLSSGNGNTALGSQAGYLLATNNFTDNTFVGHNATSTIPNIANSTAIGNGAQVTESNQIVIGNSSTEEFRVPGMVYISKGSPPYDGVNTFIGWTAGAANTTGYYNTAIGTSALAGNTSGGSNTAIGSFSQVAVTTGQSNTGVGMNSLFHVTTANGNSAFGQGAMAENVTGDYNTAIGQASMPCIKNGTQNTAVGVNAMTNDCYNAADNYNTAVGYQAGYNAASQTLTMNYSTFLGYNSGATTNNLTNSMALGNGAQVTASNQVVIGNSSITSNVMYGKLSVGGKNVGFYGNASTVSQGAGFAADTYLTGSNVLIDNPSVLLKAGTRYRLVFSGTKTAAGTAAPVITIRYGTNGTTGDASRCAMTFGAGTAAVDTGVFIIFATFRAVGGSTVIQCTGQIDHALAATGFTSTGAAGTGIIQTTGGAFDSTPANSYIGVSVNGGASAAWTITQAQAELTNLN